MRNQSDEILTIDEVAAYLKASKRTVYQLAASRKLLAFKLGGPWRFGHGDMNKLIASRAGKSSLDEDDGGAE